jgi:hypothetical protein
VEQVAEGRPPVHDGTAGADLPAPAAGPGPADAEPASGAADGRQRLADLLPLAGYLVVSAWVFRRLWADPEGRRLAWAFQDQSQHEWFLAWGAHALTSGAHPFVTAVVNAPNGVNLLANTSLLGIAVPLTPVTLLLGPAVSYVTAMTLGLAATAGGWFAVLRRAVPSRLGAAVGGAMCGFAPGMLSHANAHLNFAVQFLIPWIVWSTIRLREDGRSVRNGTVLGLLVVWQLFIGAEILTYTALGTALFLTAWALCRPAQARPLLRPFSRGLAMAALVAGVLLAYPIWFQFRGPYSYAGLPESVVGFANDLRSFPSTPTTTDGPYPAWALNIAEQNAAFGWGMLALAGVLAVWLRRSGVVVAAVVVGVVFAASSLGPEITIGGSPSGIPGPWALAGELPILDHIPASRLSLVGIPVLALLVAAGIERLSRSGRWLQVAGALAIVVALVPWVPVSKPVAARATVPEFFSSGHWRQYLERGATVVPVPVPHPDDIDAYAWQTTVDFGITLVGGYFLYPAADGAGRWGATVRPTDNLLSRVQDGAVVPVTEADRAAARADYAYWQADAVVLPVAEHRAAELAATLTDLLGQSPTRVDDVLLWNVAAAGGP